MDSLRNALSRSAATVLNQTHDSHNGGPTASFVTRILQVALGLFVTTSELPQLSDLRSDNSAVGFDCDFSLPCRWHSVGGTADRWKMARGEPDSILWLAATGTMVQPTEPFALLEVREGRLADILCSELIGCQEVPSLLSFTYWSVSASDLEICLLGSDFRRLNCTGMLQATAQPGKVALKVPPIRRSFHIAIIPNRSQGLLMVDNIKYDAKHCGADSTPPMPSWTLKSTYPSGPDWRPSSVFSQPLSPSSSTAPSPFSSTSSPSFISPTPSSASGPHSTSSPLPIPFSLGPALPMGPLIFPPLLPGPPSGIINPFVVAPLLPSSTASSATFSAIPPIGSSPLTPPPFTSFPTASPTRIAPFVVPTTDFGTGTVRPSPHVTPPSDLASLFTSTVISPRTRPKPYTRHSATVPWETGIPNILVHSSSTTTVKPLPSFELLIVGSKTRPFFDRRLGRITEQTDDLLCDFTHTFPCLWGAESGRWAIVHKGAIPSLDQELDSSEEESPQYPSIVVIQGTAMLSSDPLRCQSGSGKLLFRYWTNGRVLVQVCAIGWAVDSPKIQCVEEVAQHNRMDPNSLAVFELSDAIREPFTLNVVPIWEKNSHNNYLMIDEIAYIGECNLTALNEIEEGENEEHNGRKGEPKEVDFPGGVLSSVSAGFSTTIFSTQSPKSETKKSTATHRPTFPTTKPQSSSDATPTATTVDQTVPPTSLSSGGGRTFPTPPPPPPFPPTPPLFILSSITAPFTLPYSSTDSLFSSSATPTRETPFPPKSSKKPGTRYPFFPNNPKPTEPRHPRPSTVGPTAQSTIDPVDLIMTSTKTEEQQKKTISVGTDSSSSGEVITIYPDIAPLNKKRTKPTSAKNSFTIPYTTTQKYGTTKLPPREQNFCKLLNCDFNENACHYLNHGLTKVPWTLRTKGYGFPLNRHTDLRPASTNGQFVSTVLGPGDFAILESPHFNLSDGINVLLFQYFRPTHSSTIRLCLGTRYAKPLRTVSAFLQCPPILRSITSKHSPAKWNSVHIQLPPGTTNFYLVAHNLDRSAEKTAIAIDNIRVAICDPRAVFDPEESDYAELAGGGRMAVPHAPIPSFPAESNEFYADKSSDGRRETA
ncbi:hypothetical protein niasHS_010526 [Heterodera schachtii]|uniref:MAM domain-containing protein n=1 Tax=Heterodera schachtii TaxID=97005 RepID=A0ABD2IRT6_HETSC